MKTLISLLAILMLSTNTLWATPAEVQALLGQWAGVLPVPGGSRQVTIVVSQQADGSATARLHIDAGNTSPLRPPPVKAEVGQMNREPLGKLAQPIWTKRRIAGILVDASSSCTQSTVQLSDTFA